MNSFSGSFGSKSFDIYSLIFSSFFLFFVLDVPLNGYIYI